MSTPEEIQGQEAETASNETRSVDQPMDVATAVGQLRVLVCGLAAGLLVVSLVLGAFVYKQNRNLTAAFNARQRQISQLQANQQPLMYVINELAKYSMGKPELVAVFAKHGLQLTSKPETSGPVSAPAR
jgi:cell division protein FtsB